jgi:two-component system OmpR family sensor kinase/two-component system sensor histidine kinase BaeS
VTHLSDPHLSVRQIRRRLYLLLMQAFSAVVILSVILLIVLIGIVAFTVARDNRIFASPLAVSLEAYYAGRGSWEEVESIVGLGSFDTEREWKGTFLLDATGRILIDQGRTDSPLVGQVYVDTPGKRRVPLRAEGREVGALVMEQPPFFGPSELLGGLVRLVCAVSFLPGVLTLVIGFLLTRRVVTPLADVIAAAQSVAAGDLSTRVQVRGPGDLRSLSDSFNRMADALERDARERRNLLADIAHELRTPLTILRGRLEGIVDGIYPADETHIAPVLAETYMLERLVEDLRLLTLAETRQLHFDREPVDVRELVERATDLFGAEAAERDIAVTAHIEPGLPTVNADPQRVGQVIGNLLSNALQYTPAHGRIEIAARRVEGGVEVAVSDNGPGVPEADLPRLFDRFWRGEKSRTRAEGGAGLGLSIARQLVEAQDGAISASSAPGGGLCVAFRLPSQLTPAS